MTNHSIRPLTREQQITRFRWMLAVCVDNGWLSLADLVQYQLDIFWNAETRE